MARKSRRNKNQDMMIDLQVASSVDTIETGAYVRLSVEDQSENSIETQKMLVKNYIEQNLELHLKEIYCDNGYSGTNFNRPEFVRLMDDVRTGKIKCIVVKDLSRFGRDYLETGYYIETIFPRLNVRFIAVTDQFDSSRPEDVNSLAIPIKNMVNELYAKDLSRKIRAAYDSQMKAGTAKLKRAPYGYLINEDRTEFLVDERVAPYVSMMFQWMIAGQSYQKIADRLNLLGVVTPGNLLTPECGYKDKWRSGAIIHLLRNPSYRGDVVLGKYHQSLYRGEKRYYADEEDWYVRENAHPELVARDDFEEVRELMQEKHEARRLSLIKNETDRNELKECLSGLVYCADCNRRMYYMRYTHNYITNKKAGISYICQPKNNKARCGGQTIDENYLKIIVMDQIQNLIRSICDKKKILNNQSNGNDTNTAIHALKQQIMTLKRKIGQTEERSASLYIDFAEGIIEKTDYQFMKEKLIIEIQNHRKHLEEAEMRLRVIQKKLKKYLDMIDGLESHLGDYSFDEQLVQELVDRIYISSDGSVEIRFKCKDGYQEIVELVEVKVG